MTSFGTYDEIANRRIKIFRYIDFFEAYIRKFIKNVLEKYYGDKWMEKGLSEKLQEYLKAQKKFWMEREFEPEPEINYADLKDYPEILINKWEDIFSQYFKGKHPHDIRNYFWELKLRRDLAYHGHLCISDYDVHLVEIIIKELIIDENEKMKFEKIVNGEKLTDSEVKILLKIMLQLNGYGTIEEIVGLISKDVPTIPPNIVEIILESLVRLGLVGVTKGSNIASGVVVGAPILNERRLPRPEENIYFILCSQAELEKYPEIRNTITER